MMSSESVDSSSDTTRQDTELQPHTTNKNNHNNNSHDNNNNTASSTQSSTSTLPSPNSQQVVATSNHICVCKPWISWKKGKKKTMKHPSHIHMLIHIVIKEGDIVLLD